MNTLSRSLKSFFIVFLFAFVTALAGCTADSLTGVDHQTAPEVQADGDCDKDCPNPHNL